MEKRKTIALGKTTLVVSLPSKWTKKYGVTAGTYVSLTEDRRGLLYLAPETVELGERKTRLGIPSSFDETSITKVLQSSYCAGYDEIVLECANSSEIIKQVESALSDLVSMEITSQTKDTITLRDISGKSKEEINLLVRRSFFIIVELSKDSLAAFKEKNNRMLLDISKRDLAVDRLCFFSLRQMNKSIYELEKVPASFAFVMLAERLADLYSKVCTQASKFPEKRLEPEIIDLWDHINCIVEHIFKNYNKIDQKTFMPLFNKKKEIEKITDRIIAKSKEPETIKLVLLFQRIVELCCELMFAELIKES